MYPRSVFLALVPASLVAAVPEAPPEKALKYHEALLKRPHNTALFDRFFGAWIDEQPVEALGAFLTDRAEKNGGQDWTVLALYQLRRGQEDGALASLAKAIEAVPGDPALAMDRAKLRLRRMEFAAARTDLAAVAAGKDDALALEAAKLTGKSWLREGRSEEAIKAWDAVLASHPGDEDLLEDLVETAAAEGETAQALTYVGKLIEASKDPYQKTLRGLRRGDLLAQSGKNDEAVEAYAATLGQVGEGSWLEKEVLAQIEKVFRKQDRLDELAAQLAKLAEANPRRLLIHRQLAKLEAAQGNADAAIGRFREVLKRSPGERELREEFVRLLVDGERLDDAAVELEKLIETAPTESALYLQLAALRSRENKTDAVLAALKKAHELMGKDEGAGIRISSLMLQYGLNEPGEALLKQLVAASGAGPAPAEALAAQYGRTNRKAEAVELLKKVGAADDVDVVIRAAGAISALGESATAHEVLTGKAEKFSAEPRFLVALAQAALAAGKPADAVPPAVKLVRLAKQTTELAESVGLAGRAIAAADKGEEWRKTLEGQANRSASETCLLASLIEAQGDFAAVTKLLEASTDPLVVHFHAALLDRRGDFDTAIVVICRLADTDEGRKAAYFKDLAELQQRAGKTADAIATVERWKQSAPGDKTAWTMSSRLLRESGKPEEAVKVARQAASRFEGDTDLAAGLALLQDESGQWADAEAIYWRLYDESQSATDQARWATQLAQLALKNGRTDELDEKLRERAKGNRRSLGPLLAQAELARVLQNEDKRRDLLLEAVRVQPKDVDLRLQISALEDKAGNADRAVAVLEEALPYDNANRVRAALAQAYLRQGQALKGLREMRAMSGKKAGDPRATEDSAASLAGASLYDEAIRFMREELPDGGDWRSRYLLAVMLEEDGRENEALPLFVALLQAQGEIPGLVAPNTPGSQQMRARYDMYGEDVAKLLEYGAAAQTAYIHKQANRGRGSYFGSQGTMTGPFRLPDTPELVQSLALVHLCKLARKEGALDPKLAGLVRAAGVTNVDFMADLFDVYASGNGDFLPLIEKYPEASGLFELVGFYGRGTTPALARKVLERADKLSPLARFNAWMRVVSEDAADDKAWDAFISAAGSALEMKNDQMRSMIGYQVMSLLNPSDRPQRGAAQASKVPDSKKEALKKMVIETLVTKQEAEPEYLPMRLSALAIAGTQDQWIAAVNTGLKEYHKQPPAKKAGNVMNGRNGYSRMMQYSRYNGSSYNPWNSSETPFELPKLQSVPFLSLPQAVISQFKLPMDERYGYSIPYGGGVEVADAMKQIDRFESPLLRAWIAMLAENDAAAAKALAAKPEPDEAADFAVLEAVKALKDKKPAAAYAALEQARAKGAADRDFAMWVNVSLVAVAGEMSAEERVKITDSLQATLVQCRQTFGPQAAAAMGAMATKLGLDELAKRLQPPVLPTGGGNRGITGPAGFSIHSGRSSSSGGTSTATIERMAKFSQERKFESAAREALQVIRAQRTNPYGYSSYELRNFKEKLGEEGVKELLKLADPGDSKSLVKRLEYVDVCARLDLKEPMLAMLEKLHQERPDDASVAARMAFSLPDSRKEERNKLMTTAAKSDEFVTSAVERLEEFERGNTDVRGMVEFYDGIVSWLESADPSTLEKANLTWVSYYGKQFFEMSSGSGIQSLAMAPRKPSGKEGDKEREQNQLAERRTAVAKRMALVLLKNPSVSEEGFRLLSVSKCWEIPASEMDGYARTALMTSPVATTGGYGDSRYFILRRGNGSSSSGEDLKENSSVNWLAGRLGQVKSTEEVLPAAYLDGLKKKDAKLGGLVATLASIKTLDQLKKFWADDALGSDAGRAGSMVQVAVLTRAATIPGATGFFVDCLSKVKPNTTRYSTGDDAKERFLIQVALRAAAVAEKEEEREALCRAVGKAVYGEKPDWEKPADPQVVYQQVNLFEESLREGALDHGPAMKLCRTLNRLKLPVGTSEYSIGSSLQAPRMAKAEEAEAYLAEAGLLGDAETWSPLAAWVARWEGSGSRSQQITMKQVFLFDRVLGSREFSSSDLVKRLQDRKQGRFGSLLFAAGMTSGKQRETLAMQAFTESAAALAKMPEAKLEVFAPVMEWLPADAADKLPPVLRGKFKGADDKRRAALVKQADEFLKNKPSGTSSSSYYNGSNVTQMVRQLLPADPDKALEVFLESERRYTAAIAQGSRVSRSTYNDYEISERDSALASMFESSSESTVDAVRMLRFVAKVQASPEGGRFSYSPRYAGESSGGVLPRIGELIRQQVRTAGGRNDVPETQKMLEAAVAMDAEVRADAFAAVLCQKLDETRNGSGNVAAERKKVEAARQPLGPVYRYYQISLGLQGWKSDTPEERKATTAVLAEVLADAALREPTKQAIAFRAVTRVPELLDDPALTDLLTGSYERYCAEERSAVNGWAGALFAKLSRYEGGEAGAAAVKRFSEAFWKNAQASKAAGHANIPASLAGDLMVVSARVGDGAGAKRLLSMSQGTLVGNLSVIASLVSAQQYDLAKQLLPARGVLYPRGETLPVFTRKLEERIEGFRAAVPDAELVTRFEAKLLACKDGSGDEAPKENIQQRSERLAKAYGSHPPKDRAAQLEMMHIISQTNQLSAVILRPELAAWVKDLDYKASIDTWLSSADTKVGNLHRYQYSMMEGEMFQAASLAAMLQGDTSLLEKMTGILKAAPVLSKEDAENEYYGNTQHVVRSCQVGLMDRAAFWVWLGVARGETSGFEKALACFEDLALNTDGRYEFSQEEVNSSLAVCQFVSHWIGQPQRFAALQGKMQKRQDLAKKFPKNECLVPMANAAARFGGWKSAYFAPLRKTAVEKVFANPGFAPLLSRDGGWLDRLEGPIPADVLKEIATLPPEKIIPVVRPSLFEFRGKKMAGAKQWEESAIAFKRSLAEMPPAAEWNDIRGAVKVALAEVLVEQQKKDEAKELIGGMPVEEVGSWIKGRYKKIAPTLGVPDLTAAKTPPASPQPTPEKKEEKH
ncbi:tetratricopeptide repeat protein [Luteolibacter sp. LG18]|uniref:tetratricopeptide repeat protein n=1 Tax=Luteolibacter sp. LG18 TaxID=2819286 RepID=UPI002B31E318|nr:hypothetical protein llg_20780 [Luteolibacter sp. LG18]